MTEPPDVLFERSFGSIEVLYMLLGTGIRETEGGSSWGRFWVSEGAGLSLRIQTSSSSALSESLCEATRGIGGNTGGLDETGDSLRLLV